MVSANHLKKFAYFKGFSDPELEKLAALATEETYDAGTQIYKNGDPARCLYLIQEGKVILEIVVNREGCVSAIDVLQDPGRAFTLEAMRAVSHWQYEPARREGKPVSVYITVVVDFKLKRSAESLV